MTGKQPSLAGRRVLITRARKQASKLANELRARGASIIEIPAIEIRPPRSYRALDAALESINKYDWLILTSVNGVEALLQRLRKLRLTMAALRHLKVAAIGPATAQAIRAAGLRVRIVPREYVAEAVVAALSDKVAGKRVLLARARVARDVIPRELRRLGAQVDVVEAYETVIPGDARTRFRRVFADPRRRPDAITFTSSSTVRNFVQAVGGKRRAQQITRGIALASIGPVTSATLGELGLRADIEAGKFTISGLVRALEQHFAR